MHNRYLFVFGGMNTFGNYGVAVNDLWRYDTVEHLWSKIGPSGSECETSLCPPGRSDFGIAVSGELIVMYVLLLLDTSLGSKGC